MIFQQVNMGDIAVFQESAKICAEHPECIECPMENGKEYKNIICETGRNRDNG